MLISYLKNENTHVFKTGDNNEHCTQGITLYNHENNILLLDCQGIQHHDSSNDIKIMLFPYLISDVIIFNCNSLNNSTLKLFEPLLSFCNYIDTNKVKKPTLIFRVKDYCLTTPIEVALQDILKFRNDQYDSIRNTLTILFNKLMAVSSEPFRLTELKQLREPNNKYLEILNNDESFQYIINIIVENINNSGGQFVDNKFVENFIRLKDSINDNKKINYMELDTYSLLKEKDCLEFIDKIDKEMYVPIKVTFLQKEYDILVVDRIKQYEAILDEFNKKFEYI